MPARQSLTVDAAGLCVEFASRRDRYQHVITRQRPDGARQPLLESIEGDAADAWPPSPPLQNLTIEQFDGGRTAALLVGMAGRSHWSASIETQSGSGELVFDLACRHGASPGQLGSRYRWLIPAPERSLVAVTVESGRITDNDEQLVIEPVADRHSTPTTRWRFTVRLSGTE